MREAIRLSIENGDSGNGDPFGAVIAKNGEIIASAANQVTSTNEPTAHAEVVAIRKACELLDSYQLEGRLIYCSCELCPMCWGTIYWARPAKIYYTNSKQDAASINFDDLFIYQEIDLNIDQRKLPIIQLLRDEAYVAFAEWKANTSKI